MRPGACHWTPQATAPFEEIIAYSSIDLQQIALVVHEKTDLPSLIPTLKTVALAVLPVSVSDVLGSTVTRLSRG